MVLIGISSCVTSSGVKLSVRILDTGWTGKVINQFFLDLMYDDIPLMN